jgi:phosphoribosylformylglycinamidine synthase subunit PurS
LRNNKNSPPPMKAEIVVTPKKSVLDPQGEAVRRAIHHLGMEGAESVRVGRYIEIDLSDRSVESTRAKLEKICHDLLSNPVIEDYHLKLYADGDLVASRQASQTDASDARPKKKKKKKKDKKKKKKKKSKSKKKRK